MTKNEKNWLRPTNHNAQNEYIDEASFSWLRKRKICESASKTDRQAVDIPDECPTVPILAISVQDETWSGVEENTGYDPYATGRFGTEKV